MPPTTKPATPPFEVVDQSGRPVAVQFGIDPNEVWRIADLVGERVAKELRGEVAKVRTDMSARLDTHEKTAADAAALSAERDRVTAETLKQVVQQLDDVKAAVNALTARIDPLETEAEREKWRAEGAREARAEFTGARPSPLVVVPSPAAPAPVAEHGLALGRWTPTHVVLLASIAAVVLTGATVDWAAIIQQVLTVPTVAPPGAP